ncbi:unnamed protein product [Knipowitschia caucasica]|uniref:Protein naked cuticle homolog n=1 Tax=Knipowitschia caucasica TaxID=637954 RepID=A0AAV2KB47_KNICA
MGKLHSKLSSKCRQSPEGGVLASNLLNSQREVERIPKSNKEKISINVHRDLQSKDDLLKVSLPPEQRLEKSKNLNDENTRSTEVMFTLCNESSNSSKEEMSNFLDGVCQAIDASMKPYADSTTLKLKIVISSSDDQERGSLVEKSQKHLYCAGENIERRNHYLDLAGIENFNSKFEDEESTRQKHNSHQHHFMGTTNHYNQKEPQYVSTFNSQRTRPVWKGENSSRLPGCHPTPLCRHQSSSFKLHRSQSKRLRPHDLSLPRRPACCYHKSCHNHEAPLQSSSCSPSLRHDHHHLHEHHHHHHHHYHAA